MRPKVPRRTRTSKALPIANSNVSGDKSFAVYNEERRLGVQRGSDTLVVPFLHQTMGSRLHTLNCPQPVTSLACSNASCCFM